MLSLRDELIEDLPVALQATALKYGASARLADDDIAWINIVAAVRLDLKALMALAEDYTRRSVQEVVNACADRASDQVARGLLSSVTRAIDFGSEVVILRQRRVQTTLQLALSLVFVAALAFAVWAGANGRAGYLANRIRELERQSSSVELEQRPDWVQWWGRSLGGNPTIFIVGIREEQLRVDECYKEGLKGLCLFVK